MRIISACLFALAALSAARSAEAFDGTRKGFVLGFGAGPGITSFSQIGGDFDPGVAKSLVTVSRIGIGLSEQVLVYFGGNTSWFPATDRSGDDAFVSYGVGLAGASWYLSARSPSPYVTGLVGIATWNRPFDDPDSQIGFGLGAGVGFEFSRHWSVEATVKWGRPGVNHLFGGSTTTRATSFGITLVGMAY